ncbi:MAG TPA: hypothetical protein PK800_04930, partial [Syntrophorhabdaceae bacterium]|nr:hypothetical protein [Syntrophorhabdaceae bacterium]
MRRILALFSLLISTIFLSIVAVFVSSFDRKGKLINRLGVLWARLHLFVCDIKIHVDGVENIIQGPCVYMCNHQSVL